MSARRLAISLSLLPMASTPPPSLLLLLLLSLSLSLADDSAVVRSLSAAVSPTPSGWSSSVPPCSWPGIKCDSTSTFVTSISLPSLSLSGTLPQSLSSLSRLQTLHLQRNRLSGPLPDLAGLSSLQELLLDDNRFSSVTSLSGLTGLQTLSLNDNPSLAPWALPETLAQSTSLQSVSISNASLTGAIPDIFQSLPNLQDLRLSYNNLSGSLPGSFAGSQITNLWLNNQGLSGGIGVLASMLQLSQVWLHANAFSGPIPDLSKCENIFDLQLRDNEFTGLVPDSLLALPKLVNVSLQNNKLQGPVPEFKSGVKVTLGTTNSFCKDTVGPCDAQVTALLAVAGGFGYPVSLAEAWQGNDVCSLKWSYVNCDSTAHVTIVNLGKQGFSGTISPDLANLTMLKSLYLNDNNLTGSIPDSLTSLTQLQILDVSNNNLSGTIPKFPNTGFRLNTSGNPFIGKDIGDEGSKGTPTSGSNTPGSSPSGSPKKFSVSPAMIAGIVVAIVFFILVVLFVTFKCYIRRPHKSFSKVEVSENRSEIKSDINGFYAHGGVPSELQSQCSGDHDDLRIFDGGSVAISIHVLREVTKNFSEENILGRGGFGVVYKGELHDGTKIAVKRMESGVMGKKGMNEFQAEIAVLTKVRHRHLVALLGFCVNGNERLLVYEYMPQGTLAQHLFEWGELGFAPLSWKQRVTIALDVARGVEYLHSLAQQSFIHRDLKPSNILLGDDMRAKVADFGLVKHVHDGNHSLETRLAGTFGYLAPEYAATGRVTTKVDVYAFGVVLMEIITGRKALDETAPDERSQLVSWFRRVLINKDNMRKAIDQTLNPEEENFENICKVAELAGHCTAPEPFQRPDMGHAVNVLGPLVEQWKPSTSGHDDNEGSGIDLQMSLPQTLLRWQSDEGTSAMFDDFSYSQTHSSIPPKPSGFPNTFSSEGR